jgi:hypothetical protein
MQKTLTLIALAAGFFGQYPAEDKIFFTNDKQAFFNENDAINHGRSLAKKEGNEKEELTTVTRAETEASKSETADLESNPAGEQTPTGEQAPAGEQTPASEAPVTEAPAGEDNSKDKGKGK